MPNTYTTDKLKVTDQNGDHFVLDASGKVPIQQNVADAGKALGIGNDGRVTPVPFSGDDFTGATSSTAGVHGYVPAPAAGDQNKYLKGNGSWGTVALPNDMTGASSSAAGAHGLVPAPASGDQDKYLKGDGTWDGTLANRVDAIENVIADIPLTIASSSWTLSNGIYSYDYPSNLLTANCDVEVFLEDGAESAGIESFSANKVAVTGGYAVRFQTEYEPTGNLPLTIRIINVKADQIYELNGADISTNVIQGASNVNEALTILNNGQVSIQTEAEEITEALDTLSAYAHGILTATVAQTIANVDANDYKTGGTWYFTTGCSNVPSTYFLCTVINHGTDFAIQIGVRASAPTVVFYRVWAQNVWTVWLTPPQEYFDSTYDYYGFESKKVSSASNGYVSLLCAPGANRLQLKYTKNNTTTTKNFTLITEGVTNDPTFVDIQKFGRVCTGSIAFYASSTTGTIGTMSDAFKPTKFVRGVCRTDDIVKWGKVDINYSTGAVTYQVQTSGLYYYAQIAYISAS